MKSEKYFAIGYNDTEDFDLKFLKNFSSDGYTICTTDASEGFTFKKLNDAKAFLKAINPLLIQTFNIYEINVIITLKEYSIDYEKY